MVNMKLIISLIVVLPIYFFPAIINNNRKAYNPKWFFLANLIIGFTGYGWLYMLLLAYDKNKTVTVINNTTVNKIKISMNKHQ